MIDILIVEPDKVLAKTYKQALQAAGHKTAVQTRAQTAIHSVDRQGPKLIITELQLAEHNGVEFLYELRSYPEWQTIPVIVLSSVPPNEAGLSKDVMARLNIAKYCYKSQTNLEQLASVVQEVLAS